MQWLWTNRFNDFTLFWQLPTRGFCVTTINFYDATGGIRGLGKVSKLYLENTNLAYVLGKEIPDTGNIRETFFFNQLAMLHDVVASPQSDFQVDGYTFEIGGRNKGNDQIQGLDKAYIVKDDIEYGFGNTIPLWHFGFLY